MLYLTFTPFIKAIMPSRDKHYKEVQPKDAQPKDAQPKEVQPKEVQHLSIHAQHDGQRIDNFLFSHLKGVPKSHVYRLLRKGQIRVDGKRMQPKTKLQQGQILRLPPISISERPEVLIGHHQYQQLCERILLETDAFIALNKPAHLAVHAGTGVEHGLIEILKAHHHEPLELAHRLDRDTSGIILLAKGRHNLNLLQQAFRERAVFKSYLALLAGKISTRELIENPLERYTFGSERRVKVSQSQHAKSASSEFVRQEYFAAPSALGGASLCKVNIKSGRTHQIRVHAAYRQHALAGDTKYASTTANAAFKQYGLERLFLHAHEVAFELNGTAYHIKAQLDVELGKVLERLR